jgi:hypothetical protein
MNWRKLWWDNDYEWVDEKGEKHEGRPYTSGMGAIPFFVLLFAVFALEWWLLG